MRSKTADEILEKIRNKKTPYFVTYNGLWIRVDSEVYPPSADSFFLADNLRGIFGVKQGERVFDYGCGSGILSLVSANCGGNVVGVDINPNAVNCARINASTNNLDINIEIRQGGFGALFEEERFDVVAANLPFENSTPADLLEYSVYDPGFRMRHGLFRMKKHLSANGRIFFTYSERVLEIESIEKFTKGFCVEVIDRKIIDGET